MSRQLVNEYFNEIDRLRKFSGTATENVIRGAFRDLLKMWARQKNLQFIDEFEFQSTQKTRIRPDGTIKHDLRLDLGYWEAKDTGDDLDTEIDKKLRKGYPQTNIIFENSDRAVLIQNRDRVFECSMIDGDALLKLLNLFFGYERQEIHDFRQAVSQFQHDLPDVLEALRGKINDAYEFNAAFRDAALTFLEHAKDTINPTLGEVDVREMLIQHILTEEIFTHVFNEGDFHRENNIAKRLYALEGAFFTGAVKRETLKALETYYATIRSTAALIDDHAEKQKFLKAIYEGFYKVYNPDAADRLGVVYTPNEIVKFMIEGADWLTQKHFGKALIDKGVEILDPATGTGTFVCELLEHFRGQPEKLAYKYKEEIHANEVAILPYYVANLNIEATYAAITGQFAEYPSLCFVDTLDNLGWSNTGAGRHQGAIGDLLSFSAMTEENVERVKRQNERRISVVIANPPYNANQQNENDNNKNRTYPQIDGRIKATYISRSTAQKTKVYDMYARFFRWASDRLGEEGVVAFITNRSFIESRTFDGFRKSVADEFSEIYVMDLGGDVRANPKLSGTKHNVFGIQTGVAVSFLVRTRKRDTCRIYYARRPEFDTAVEKLDFLGQTKAEQIGYERIEPDRTGNWINLADENDWDDLVPVASKETKAAKQESRERAIFKLFSLGVVTARDEWVYDFSSSQVGQKANSFIEVYESERQRWFDTHVDRQTADWVSREIKWTSELEAYLANGLAMRFEPSRIRQAAYRPFVKKWTYYDRIITHRLYQQDSIFPVEQHVENRLLVFSDPSAQKPWMICASEDLPDLHYVGPAAGTVCGPRYRYSAEGKRIDNITDWALEQFQKAYEERGPSPGADAATSLSKGEAKTGHDITKDNIFHYVYGVLHDPVYREKYAINLKREFPRIPFYPEFSNWVSWGERLMALHIGYEGVEPWDLTRADMPDEKAREAGVTPKAMLKADKDNGRIVLDSETVLSDLPPEVWEYRLGNRSGVEWILDQYKEKTPKDPTIREKFNTYRFADYKEKVIDLIARVTRVSVETVAITEAMKGAKREAE